MCGIFTIVNSQEISSNCVEKSVKKLINRGPDCINIKKYTYNNNFIYMGFTRLAIIDLSDSGMQPFEDSNASVICNGEIYNYRELIYKHNLQLDTNSDCGVIIPLYNKLGFSDMINKLDAEFALVLYDIKKNKIYAARDKYGVRPLFYGLSTNQIAFSSEIKALKKMKNVYPLEPHQYIEFDLCDNSVKFFSYFNYKIYDGISENKDTSLLNLYLTKAVKKRLHSDRPIGFLLSGGLDSSLIVAIATKILKPDNIVTFSIGVKGSPDVEAAKIVTKYLGIDANHHVIDFNVEQGFDLLPKVIKTIESYDVTTIRASTPQYLMAKYISENTNIKVLLSGEGSDEIHGSYRYFRDAPDKNSFHNETIRLLKELYMFDNLRTDRTMASCGLEVRVPFLDFDYVKYIKNIDPELLMFKTNWMEKKIVRDSFKNYLPDEILYRSKEAFSDAVSSNDVNWFKYIQNRVDSLLTDSNTNTCAENKLQQKDALYFRQLFNKFYPNRENVISHIWLPRFQKDNVTDPSATVLNCY